MPKKQILIFTVIRFAGMGNAVLSCTGMKENYHLNPAVLSFRQKGSTTILFNGIAYLNPNAPKFFNFINSNRENIISNFNSNVDDPTYNLDLVKYSNKYNFRGLTNFSFDIIKQNFALSLISAYRQAYKLEKYLDNAILNFQDNLSFIAQISYSKKIPFYKRNSDLSIGFSFQNYFSNSNSNVKIQDEEDFNLFYSSFSPNKFFENYSDVLNRGEWSSGYYFDVGLLYQLKKYNLNIAAVLKNVIGKRETEQPDFYANLGTSYYPAFFQNRKFVKHFLLAWNIINLGRSNQLLKDSNILGTEIRFPFIDCRAGLFRGNVTYGFGLNLGAIHFDVASGYYQVFGSHISHLYLIGLKIGE